MAKSKIHKIPTWIGVLDRIAINIERADTVPYQYITELNEVKEFLQSIDDLDFKVVEKLVEDRTFYVLYEDWPTRFAIFYALTTSEESAEAWVAKSPLCRTFRAVEL